MPTYAFWALTRLGAAVLLYGPLNRSIHPEIVEQWLEQCCRSSPATTAKRTAGRSAWRNLARLTGQRALDVDDETGRRCWPSCTLEGAGGLGEDGRGVVEMEAGDRGQMFGESLPIGLRLVG